MVAYSIKSSPFNRARVDDLDTADLNLLVRYFLDYEHDGKDQQQQQQQGETIGMVTGVNSPLRC